MKKTSVKKFFPPAFTTPKSLDSRLPDCYNIIGRAG